MIDGGAADASRRAESMAIVIKNLDLEHLWIIYPGEDAYRLSEKATVMPIAEVLAAWRYPEP